MCVCVTKCECLRMCERDRHNGERVYRYVCVCECMCVCVYMWMSVCGWVCVDGCGYGVLVKVHECGSMWIKLRVCLGAQICMTVCYCVCVFVCVCVCVCVRESNDMKIRLHL